MAFPLVIPKDSLLFMKNRVEDRTPDAFNVWMYYAKRDFPCECNDITVYNIQGDKTVSRGCIVGMITPDSQLHGVTYHARKYIPFDPNPNNYRSYADTR